MARLKWIAFIFLVTGLGGWWTWVSREEVITLSGVENLTEAPLAGYLAPDFTLTSTQGETIRLTELQGQPVVLNFWATWCPPCRAEMPELEASSQEFRGFVTFLGVDQGEDDQTVAKFGQEFQISYPLLIDSDSQVNNLYGIRALPTTIFIDANGVVREVYSGILNQAILQSKLEQMGK